MELADQMESFRARGLGLAALSYDDVPLLADFAERKQIPYPLLSDPDSASIRRFGLVNPEYPEGHKWHGLALPGTFVTDAKGVIQAKFFEESYRVRRTAGSVFVLAGDPGQAESWHETDAFRLQTATSNDRIFPGNRVSLVLDFELKEGLHAYAPGEHRYRALKLSLDPDARVEVHPAVYPATRDFRFEPLDETVPVFEGRFRLLQDVTIAASDEVKALPTSETPELTLAGVLEYQVCSKTVCHPPAELPVSWTLRVRPLETERVPEELRRK